MPGSELRKNLLIALFAVLAAGEAWAQNVFVMSISGNQAQVIINGATVRTLRLGDTAPEGVRLADIRGGTAVFEIAGKRVPLALGQSTLVQTTLRADAAGHFVLQAVINGVAVPAIIDTGATDVTLNMA